MPIPNATLASYVSDSDYLAAEAVRALALRRLLVAKGRWEAVNQAFARAAAADADEFVEWEDDEADLTISYQIAMDALSAAQATVNAVRRAKPGWGLWASPGTPRTRR